MYIISYLIGLKYSQKIVLTTHFTQTLTFISNLVKPNSFRNTATLKYVQDTNKIEPANQIMARSPGLQMITSPWYSLFMAYFLQLLTSISHSLFS